MGIHDEIETRVRKLLEKGGLRVEVNWTEYSTAPGWDMQLNITDPKKDYCGKHEQVPDCISDEDHLWEDVMGSTDSRDEWTTSEEVCRHCGITRTRRTTYDQNGLVVSDEYEYEGD